MARYAVVIEKTGNGYAAGLPALPGCVAAGDTLEETKALIGEAVRFHVEALTEDGLPIPEPLPPESWEEEYGMPIPESVEPGLFIEISVPQDVPAAARSNLKITY
ncbi:MAG: type II toxin-antitoxin system HicB family antitoxin [Dehalococcoidia bacterium]|nr:type II toxin-antitoxin system HicB family antitoxin [Dehalococcoidia bacterium]